MEVILLGTGVLANQLSKKKSPKSDFHETDFHGVNISTVADLKLPLDITECRVGAGKR